MAITATIFGTTQTDLERALGGASALKELTDWDGDGTADEAVVQSLLDAGGAEVKAAVEVKHDPETIADLDTSSLQLCRDANARLSARIAWERGGRGQAVADHIEAAAQRAERFLDQLARGERRLGRGDGSTAAAINQPVGVVDYDELSQKVSIAGFKLGFR